MPSLNAIRRCNPDAIARDPIRALRGVRQSAQFGFRIERETQGAIRAYAPNLLDTSIERVRDELFKLLALPKPRWRSASLIGWAC